MTADTLDALLGQSDQPLILFDRIGAVAYANRAFEVLSGATAAYARATETPLLEPPILVARALDRTWTVPTGRVWLRCADGTRRQVWVDALPMSVDGEMMHLCTVRPTTLEVTTPAVGLDDARLRELLANLPGGVYRCSYDRHWRTIFMSERFADICGCPSAEFLEPYGRSFKEIVVEEDVQVIQDAVREAIRQRSYYEIEFRIRRPDGEVRWLLDRGMPVADRKGRVRWLDGAMFDITAQKDAEARAEAAELERAAAQAASAAKSRFLAVMSHEMRTPLNAIVGMTTVLADSALDERQRSLVDTVRGSTDALLDVINNVLDFSKVDMDQVELATDDFDLHGCVESSMLLLRPRAKAKGLHFSARIADDVPRWVRGDGARLRQVLVNLLSNAVKFTADGAVCCTVEARRAGEVAEVEVAISDTGIGIPAERQSDIFAPFQQVDLSSTRRYEGSGLGLAIVHGLVTRMGGAIEVESAPRAGSTFRVRLTLPIGEAPRREMEATPATALRPLRILLAEDNPINQRVGVGLLELIGQTADVAADGVEALDALRRAPYDLVLMDIRMPELDGLEATRRLRALLPPERQPRVVAVTANATREDEADCYAAGMDGFLSKPLRVDALQAALTRLFAADAGDAGADDADAGADRADRSRHLDPEPTRRAAAG